MSDRAEIAEFFRVPLADLLEEMGATQGEKDSAARLAELLPDPRPAGFWHLRSLLADLEPVAGRLAEAGRGDAAAMVREATKIVAATLSSGPGMVDFRWTPDGGTFTLSFANPDARRIVHLWGNSTSGYTVPREPHAPRPPMPPTPARIAAPPTTLAGMLRGRVACPAAHEDRDDRRRPTERRRDRW